MTADKMQFGAHLANITASITAVLALVFGAYQFYHTQSMQRENLEYERETKSVELFIKYNELRREAAYRRAKGNRENMEWRNNVLLGIAQSIWTLRHDVPEWRNTIEWMLTEEDKSSRINGLGCGTYDIDFIDFTRHAVGHEVCEEKNKNKSSPR